MSVSGEAGGIPVEAGTDVASSVRPDRGPLLPELGRLHDHDRAAHLHPDGAALPTQHGEGGAEVYMCLMSETGPIIDKHGVRVGSTRSNIVRDSTGIPEQNGDQVTM